MAKEKMEEKDIRLQLYEVRKESKEEYLKLLGVDIPKLRTFEKQIDKKYEELIPHIQKKVKQIGKNESEQHRASFKRAKYIYELDAEAAITNPFNPNTIVVFKTCKYHRQAEYEDRGNSDPIYNPPVGGSGTGSVTYDNNIAHPYVNVSGQGSGTKNSVLLETWYKYSFYPRTTKTYCIKPFIYLNGHWFLWTWGGGCGSSGDVGKGHVKLTLSLRIDQLSVPVQNDVSRVIIDQYAEEGADFETGFAYNSEVNPSLATRVELVAGDQAVIWVKCECFVEIENHGRAWIDMQTSPYFYFKVPEVKWGWPIIYSPFPPWIGVNF